MRKDHQRAAEIFPKIYNNDQYVIIIYVFCMTFWALIIRGQGANSLSRFIIQR